MVYLFENGDLSSFQNLDPGGQPLQRPDGGGADGPPGALRVDAVSSARPSQQANPHLHDPDRGAVEPPERARHTHAQDQGALAGTGHLDRQDPHVHQCAHESVCLHQVALVVSGRRVKVPNVHLLNCVHH